MIPKTITTITNLYLFGQEKAPDICPDARMNAQWLRPPDATTTLEMDATSFMQHGPGRFALGPKFELVNRFFEDATLPVGRYTKQQLGAHYDLTHYGWRMQHYDVRDGVDDYAERVYLYNSQAFKIADGASFVVDAEGRKYIDGFAIEPRSHDGFTHDNFDFHSSNMLAKLGNDWLEQQLDPAHIGRRVNLHFTGTPLTRRYTSAEYDEDQRTIALWMGHHPVMLAQGMNRLVKSLCQQGSHSAGCPHSHAALAAWQQGHISHLGEPDIGEFVRALRDDRTNLCPHPSR